MCIYVSTCASDFQLEEMSTTLGATDFHFSSADTFYSQECSQLLPTLKDTNFVLPGNCRNPKKETFERPNTLLVEMSQMNERRAGLALSSAEHD